MFDDGKHLFIYPPEKFAKLFHILVPICSTCIHHHVHKHTYIYILNSPSRNFLSGANRYHEACIPSTRTFQPPRSLFLYSPHIRGYNLRIYLWVYRLHHTIPSISTHTFQTSRTPCVHIPHIVAIGCHTLVFLDSLVLLSSLVCLSKLVLVLMDLLSNLSSVSSCLFH